MPAVAGDPGAGRDRRISAGLAREGRPVTARLTRRPGGQARLRALLDSGQTIVAPGAFDPLSARLVEEAGFQAVYMTGFGTSAALIGRPDVGLLTMTEMAGNAGRIAACVDVPVIADADTGYGNPLNVIRTVGAYEAAGVAGIHIEDQVAPKKCGHMEGKLVIPAEEMVQKVRAAVEARTQPEFVIIARTDARAVEGLEQFDRVREPPPYARQRLTENMLTDRTPEIHKWALAQFHDAHSEGQFVPFSVGTETVIFPGFDGGANGAAPRSTPAPTFSYVNSNEMAWMASLGENKPGNTAKSIYLSQCAICHGDKLARLAACVSIAGKCGRPADARANRKHDSHR